jgi:hypothetical protein
MVTKLWADTFLLVDKELLLVGRIDADALDLPSIGPGPGNDDSSHHDLLPAGQVSSTAHAARTHDRPVRDAPRTPRTAVAQLGLVVLT